MTSSQQPTEELFSELLKENQKRHKELQRRYDTDRLGWMTVDGSAEQDLANGQVEIDKRTVQLITEYTDQTALELLSKVEKEVVGEDDLSPIRDQWAAQMNRGKNLVRKEQRQKLQALRKEYEQ